MKDREKNMYTKCISLRTQEHALIIVTFEEQLFTSGSIKTTKQLLVDITVMNNMKLYESEYYIYKSVSSNVPVH